MRGVRFSPLAERELADAIDLRRAEIRPGFGAPRRGTACRALLGEVPGRSTAGSWVDPPPGATEVPVLAPIPTSGRGWTPNPRSGPSQEATGVLGGSQTLISGSDCVSCIAGLTAIRRRRHRDSRPFAVRPSRSSAGVAGHRFPLRLSALASLR